MNEYETVSEFHIKLSGIDNTSFALGEKMSGENLTKKILRLLPKKFDMEVTGIEEAYDLSSIKVDEHIGSLQTFEMCISERSEKNNKGIAFVSNTTKDGI